MLYNPLTNISAGVSQSYNDTNTAYNEVVREDSLPFGGGYKIVSNEPSSYLSNAANEYFDKVSAYNTAEALRNRAFQSSEAEKNRAFQERLSSSAYQRAVADMRAAGLNPALMYSSGAAASTPSGSYGSGDSAMFSGGFASAFDESISKRNADTKLLGTVFSGLNGLVNSAVRAVALTV